MFFLKKKKIYNSTIESVSHPRPTTDDMLSNAKLTGQGSGASPKDELGSDKSVACLVEEPKTTFQDELEPGREEGWEIGNLDEPEPEVRSAQSDAHDWR